MVIIMVDIHNTINDDTNDNAIIIIVIGIIIIIIIIQGVYLMQSMTGQPVPVARALYCYVVYYYLYYAMLDHIIFSGLFIYHII